MKTTKIITTLSTIAFVFFMSVTSISSPLSSVTGDVVKLKVKNHISTSKGNISKIAAARMFNNDFQHLKFNVDRFITKNENIELVSTSLDYLRFDVNKFMDNDETRTMELPVENILDYIRFDVNNYNSTSELTESQEMDLNYLKFDVNKFLNENPANDVE